MKAVVPPTTVNLRDLDPGNLRTTQRLDDAPQERDRALLIRTDPAKAGQVLRLEGSVFGLGRHPDNHACLDDDGISRFHARITRTDQSFWVEDLKSSNGTYINGRRITSCELSNGDTLNLGSRVAFRFAAASEREEKALTQLYESSVRDPLTGAFNRQYFANHLESELAYAVRHSEPLSVLLLDLDHFKRINDTYGHQGGDTALIHVGHVFHQRLRGEDLLARYGGEEFVIVLRGIPLDKATAVAERLRASLEEKPAAFGDKAISVTASFGCASVACHGCTTTAGLVGTADRRLYRAKEAGRNRVIAEG